MKLFSRPDPIRAISEDIFRIAQPIWDKIHSDVIDAAPPNYDKDLIEFELTILTYSAFRIAIQSTNASYETLRNMYGFFDQRACDILHFSAEFDELLQRRGGQYLKHLNQYRPDIANGDFQHFSLGLSQLFDQFCRGEEDFNPLNGGDALDMFSLGVMANKYWNECFWKPYEYLMKCNLK